MSVKVKMTAIADAIRSKTGGTTKLTLDQMAIEIEGIETGVELPTLSNEGSASDLLSGKQLIDQNGNVVTGTIATKTSSDLTASGATVTVPAGYYASQATKSVATATQATPSVSIDSAGKITASATQTAGYVAAGTKTGTKQLTTKGATTYTPKTSNQTIASGTYLTGTQTIKGDSNLVAGNIKSGVSIFGVSGSYAGSSEDLSTELTTQETLITELETVLAGKAAGGGSGGNLKTCTLNVIDNVGYGSVDVTYNTLINGKPSVFRETVKTGNNTFQNVICGSVLYVAEYSMSGSITALGCTSLGTMSFGTLYSVDEVENATVTISSGGGGYA